nr:tripartite motif-containing protein 59-like [Procambarus clarkii]
MTFDNKPEECSVCYNDYDDNQLRPRTLPCGHTFCSQCIDNAIENGQLTCPSCRAEHAATAATQFPISYAVEAFVRKLKDIQLTQKKTVPVKKKLDSLVQEQKSSISSLITSCEEDNKPEECSVCYNDYDDNQLRPRTLPCGHTFCSQCIDNAIENGQLTCPSCRAEHAATAATQFPISYAVEAFVRKLKDIQLTQKKTVPVKKKLDSLVQEQKSSISSLITSCEETISQDIELRFEERKFVLKYIEVPQGQL